MLGPWNLNNQLGEGSEGRAQINRVEEFFTVHPDSSVGEVLKQLNDLPCRPKPCVAALTHLSNEHWGVAVKKFSTLSICSWGPGLLPFGCSGFRVPVFLNWSSNHYNVKEESFWNEDGKTVFRRPCDHWIGVTFSYFKTIHLALSFERGQWIWSAKLGCSVHHSLSASSLSELQSISRRLRLRSDSTEISRPVHKISGRRSVATFREKNLRVCRKCTETVK